MNRQMSRLVISARSLLTQLDFLAGHSTRITDTCHMPGFFCELWALNSAPCACKASACTWLTVISPVPQFWCLEFIILSTLSSLSLPTQCNISRSWKGSHSSCLIEDLDLWPSSLPALPPCPSIDIHYSTLGFWAPHINVNMPKLFLCPWPI